MARNRVIGVDNKLPWHLPGDLKRFKALTMGHHIIMGRKTFESIGRLLPGRTTVILSRNRAYRVEGAQVFPDIDSALAQCAGDPEVFIVGGEGVFLATLPIADRIYLTEIDHDFPGDTFFPALGAADWHEIAREDHFDDASKLAYRYLTLDRAAW